MKRVRGTPEFGDKTLLKYFIVKEWCGLYLHDLLPGIFSYYHCCFACGYGPLANYDRTYCNYCWNEEYCFDCIEHCSNNCHKKLCPEHGKELCNIKSEECLRFSVCESCFPIVIEKRSLITIKHRGRRPTWSEPNGLLHICQYRKCERVSCSSCIKFGLCSCSPPF